MVSGSGGGAGGRRGRRGTHLGDELEEGAERRVVDELRLELGTVVGGERAEPAVGGDVLLGHHVGERGAELGRRLEELARRLLVLLALEVREPRRHLELAGEHDGVRRVGGRLGLRDVVGDVGEVAHVHLQGGERAVRRAARGDGVMWRRRCEAAHVRTETRMTLRHIVMMCFDVVQ